MSKSVNGLNPHAAEFIPAWYQPQQTVKLLPQNRYLCALLKQPEIKCGTDGNQECTRETITPQQERESEDGSKTLLPQNLARVVKRPSADAKSKLRLHWMRLSREQARNIAKQELQQKQQYSCSTSCSIKQNGWFMALGPQSDAYQQQHISNADLCRSHEKTCSLSSSSATVKNYVNGSQGCTVDCELLYYEWWVAIWKCDMPEITKLIRAGFPWDCTFDPVKMIKTDSAPWDESIVGSLASNAGMNILQLYACREQYSLALAQLLDEVAALRTNIDHRDRRNTNKRTPLHLACDANNIDAARALVAHGASLVARDKFGDTPLHLAVTNRASNALVVYLCEQNRQAVNMRNKRLETPLMLATRREVALTLISSGADIGGCNVDGFDIITLAAMSDNFSLLETIVLSNGIGGHRRQHQALMGRMLKGKERGVISSGRQHQQYVTSALHQSVQRQNQRAVELLLSSGRFLQQLNETDRPRFYTPLMYAAELGDVEMFLMLLLKYGADPTIEELNGLTAIAIAAINKHLNFLHEVGCSIQSDHRLTQLLFAHVNFRGESILHAVARSVTRRKGFANAKADANTISARSSHSDNNDINVMDKYADVLICLLQRGSQIDAAFLQQYLAANWPKDTLGGLIKFDAPLSQWHRSLMHHYVRNRLPAESKQQASILESRHIWGDFDVVIVLEEGQVSVQAHSLVLRQRGGVLAAMLDSGIGAARKCFLDSSVSNAKHYRLDLHHMRACSFNMLLRWLYEGQIDGNLDSALVVDLLLTANELLLNDLQLHCEILFCRILHRAKLSSVEEDSKELNFDVAMHLMEIVDLKVVGAYVDFCFHRTCTADNKSRKALASHLCSSSQGSGAGKHAALNRVVAYLQQIVSQMSAVRAETEQRADQLSHLVELLVTFVVECEHELITALDGQCLTIDSLLNEELSSSNSSNSSSTGVSDIQIQRLCEQLLSKLDDAGLCLSQADSNTAEAQGGFSNNWLLRQLKNMLQSSVTLFRAHNAMYVIDPASQARLIHRQLAEAGDGSGEAATSGYLRSLIVKQQVRFSMWPRIAPGIETAKAVRGDMRTSDVTVRCVLDGAATPLCIWNCHKHLLSARCPKFEAMIRFREAQQKYGSAPSNFADSDEDCESLQIDIDVAATPPAAMDALLTFMYTGTIVDISRITMNAGHQEGDTIGTLLQLMRIADEFLFDEFSNELRALLLAKLDSSNALRIYCSPHATRHREVQVIVALHLLKECNILNKPQCKPLSQQSPARHQDSKSEDPSMDSADCDAAGAGSVTSLFLHYYEEYELLLRELFLRLMFNPQTDEEPS